MSKRRRALQGSSPLLALNRTSLVTASDRTALLWPSAVCVQIKGEDELRDPALPVNIEITPRSLIGGVEV